uniref:Putative secreted protein n=1 Tax=Amblyomma cajennense TaxID=34607 RepID=A0A023FB76_AMBCJ
MRRFVHLCVSCTLSNAFISASYNLFRTSVERQCLDNACNLYHVFMFGKHLWTIRFVYIEPPLNSHLLCS